MSWTKGFLRRNLTRYLLHGNPPLNSPVCGTLRWDVVLRMVLSNASSVCKEALILWS